MRYRIETWENSHDVHYSDELSRAQVEANLHRSGDEVRLAVLLDLDRKTSGAYVDFAQRTFTVTLLDN